MPFTYSTTRTHSGRASILPRSPTRLVREPHAEPHRHSIRVGSDLVESMHRIPPTDPNAEPVGKGQPHARVRRDAEVEARIPTGTRVRAAAERARKQSRSECRPNVVAEWPHERPVVADRSGQPPQPGNFISDVGPRISGDGTGKQVDPNVERSARDAVEAEAGTYEHRLLAQKRRRLHSRLHEQAAPGLRRRFGDARTGHCDQEAHEDTTDVIRHNVDI